MRRRIQDQKLSFGKGIYGSITKNNNVNGFLYDFRQWDTDGRMLGNQDDGVLATGDDVGALNGDGSQLGSVGIAKIVGPLALYRWLFGCHGKIVLSGDSGVRSGDLYDSGCVIILFKLHQGQETGIVTVETSDSLQMAVAVLLDDGAQAKADEAKSPNKHRKRLFMMNDTISM
eukprot:CAMPEP_0197262054 /NCGR_PEP_ID=MMETSP1432-20130617/301_1 /TAXON_ID=44447 /ORGANISM="Pseudo-nitzschia delicatissima, Strain UNC1205" /LENGTH=172 /DNA_ID=CAMNT_0042726353 /DNA_START=489 /DNA_END=1008 /DNA_ORIENTATION=+